jgi:hypothetical protein
MPARRHAFAEPGGWIMLAKSKKSAVIMGMIFLIPAVAIAFVVGEVRYSLLDPAERNPNVVNGFAGLVPVLTAAAIALVCLGLAFLVIYRLDESHYGRQGAVRWAVAGTIYGLLQQVVLTPIPSDFDFGVGSILKQIGGDLLWKVLTLVLSYLLVFPLFSLLQNWRRKSRKG